MKHIPLLALIITMHAACFAAKESMVILSDGKTQMSYETATKTINALVGLRSMQSNIYDNLKKFSSGEKSSMDIIDLMLIKNLGIINDMAIPTHIKVIVLAQANNQDPIKEIIHPQSKL